MKMYKQPTTEVMNFKTASLMDEFSVSPGTPTDTNNPPAPGMPRRGNPID